MKKGKSRNKRKKTRSRLLWIAIAVIGIAAVISAVCVAGMLETKENAWRTPEELLVEYMYHIPQKEYEEMYAMLHVEASGSISQEDFIKRNYRCGRLGIRSNRSNGRLRERRLKLAKGCIVRVLLCNNTPCI